MGAYEKTLIQVQKLANNSAKEIQKMINKSNTEQMNFNSAEAQKSRDWQEKMSKSAHQMEVADLKKAGLNPVLSTGGAGAQSYTTSSASTQNDSGASAASAILEGQISALTQLESNRLQTEAQLKASSQQAAATRYAAAQQSAAARYAADMSYQSTKYHSDVQNEMNKRTTEANKWISVNKQASSVGGLFDKYFSKIQQSGVRSGMRSFSNKMGKSLNTLGSNVNKYFSNNGKITQDNFKLNKSGQNYVDKLLKQNGFTVNRTNRRMAVRAFVFRDPTSYRNFMNMYQVNHWKHGSHGTPRRGHL